METNEDIRAAVALLDTRFQAAVKANDADAMAAILHDDMVLILGNGVVRTKADLVAEAISRRNVYAIQDEEPGSQTVRVFGEAAVVTAKLRKKGHASGAPFDRTVWFSDTYVRTRGGWRYALGQTTGVPRA